MQDNGQSRGGEENKKDDPDYSRYVYPGSDGSLVYKSNDRGDVIPDFSHAGYRGGGVMLSPGVFISSSSKTAWAGKLLKRYRQPPKV